MTPEVVVAYVSAFVEFAGGGSIAVGRDGRPSGAWIEDVVAGTLNSCGARAELLGVSPTPTVQMSTERSTARGGISITASHNPSPWNGLKFLNADGIFLDPAECEAFFALVDRHERSYAGWDGASDSVRASFGVEQHVEAAAALPFVDPPRLHQRRFRVVVDAVNASGSVAVPMLLERLGCDVVRLHCDGSGIFPHTPEPLPENLTSLADAVREHGADLGVAVDPDADRLVLIDEQGTPIGEEYTITLAVDYMLAWARRHAGWGELRAVVNLSTTRAVEDVAAKYGAEMIRTPVGEINVARRMKEVGAVIGGEGSGGVILPALHTGRDSLAGIVITLAALLESGLTLSELRATLPTYEIVKKKIPVEPGTSPAEILDEIRLSTPPDVPAIATDGLRLAFERSWVHMRASNTEPIIRVIAEAPTRAEAEALAEKYVGAVRALQG